jgi:hypothetical protein
LESAARAGSGNQDKSAALKIITAEVVPTGAEAEDVKIFTPLFKQNDFDL